MNGSSPLELKSNCVNGQGHQESSLHIDKLSQEIIHLEYAKAVLDKQLSVLKEQLHISHSTFHEDKKTKMLAMFFQERGFFIVGLRSNDRPAHTLDKVAKQIWSSRKVSRPFIRELLSSPNEYFTYDTLSLNHDEKSSLKNLCDSFVHNEWMTYQIAENHFAIRPTIPKQSKVFLNGGWAEVINRYLILKALNEFTKKNTLKYKIFWDIKLKRINSKSSNHNDMQLDLVVELRDRFYIFETKSGYNLAIDKWVDRSNRFAQGSSRYITCCADETLNPLIFAPFRLFALPTLEKQFTELLERDASKRID